MGETLPLPDPSSIEPSMRPLSFASTSPAATLLAVVHLAAPAPADVPAGTERVSVSSSEDQGDDASGTGFGRKLAISADGRFVAFTSFATNLVPGDTNGEKDVFLRDRLTGETVRASVGHQGQQSDGRSDGAAVSDDGRWVAYFSYATNLAPGDTNGLPDVFLFDALAGTSEPVSRSLFGGFGNSSSETPSLSADGRYVCFWSAASDLTGADTNGAGDVFVFDRVTKQTALVSTLPGGGQGNGNSRTPHISRDGEYVTFASLATNFAGGDTNGAQDVFLKSLSGGQLWRVDGGGAVFDGPSSHPVVAPGGRWVAFASDATDVVPGDTNGLRDVFVFDRFTGQSERVSVATSGAQADGGSDDPDISNDGAWVAFESEATNLIPDDTNGWTDVFLRQRSVGWTERVSRRNKGGQGNFSSYFGVVSGDGRLTAFLSAATNLVPKDTNATSDVFVRDRAMSTGEVGAEYCTSNPNSSGAVAGLAALGSPVVADDDLTLASTDLPANKPGYFLMSDAQGFVPLFGGGQGNLCLASPIVRFSADVLDTGALGTISFQPQLGNLPQGTVVQPGEAWNFQLWFRDSNPDLTSNTSNAVCVEFR